MKTLIKFFALIALFLPSLSFAASAEGVATALNNSRDTVVALMKSSDKAAEPALVDAIKQSSAAVDSAIEAVLADSATSEEVRKNVTECKGIWEESKKARDTEIVPAILSGDKDSAKKVARGAQSDRFKKMQALLK